MLRLVVQIILALAYGTGILVAILGRAMPRRGWQPNGRIVVTGTFHNPGWYLSHITPLENEAMPLFRYRNGDSAHAVDGKCPCGRQLTLPLKCSITTLTRCAGRIFSVARICSLSLRAHDVKHL